MEEQNPLNGYLYQEDLSFLSDIGKLGRSKKISINVKCVYPDPEKPGQLIPRSGSLAIDCNKPVSTIPKEFLQTYPDIPNQHYYVGYEQLLFREGTLQDCGITHGKMVEMISPGKNAPAYHNQGLALILWSIIPLIFGVSALIFSMMKGSTDNTEVKALYLLIGLLFLIPSILVLVIGMILIPQCPTPCYFNGNSWV
jgi:hypothetical protein